jgi:hypothetical protein
MTNEKFHHKLGDAFTGIPWDETTNEPTSKFEKAVPAGLLLGPRFRLGLPINNWPLAVCVAMRAARFPFDFVFGLTFCAMGKEMGEGGAGSAL